MNQLLLILCCASIFVQAQTDVAVPMPVLLGASNDRMRIHIDTSGTDANDGSPRAPVKTFARALELLKAQTALSSGRVPCAVHYAAGRHLLAEPIMQRAVDHAMTGPNGRRWLEISIEGEDSTTLDGTMAIVPPGHGLITLCGSGITIERLRVYNSPSFGIRLGHPDARSTNVLLYRVVVDSTYSHGIKIGDAESSQSDTVALIDCRVRATNLSNDGGTALQFGSAIKMFGARDVTIKNCGLERNWGEAISVNNSQRVDISDTWILDNWGIGVYADIAADVRVHGCLFRSTGDTTVFNSGQRGMVGVLCSNEAYAAHVSDYRTERIDVFNNVFLGLSGSLDLWEGAMSFLQRGAISRVRFAHNTCVGMRSGSGDRNVAFINVVHSQPKPLNREFSNIAIANNVFAADSLAWPAHLWVRIAPETRSAVSFTYDRWRTLVPTVGTADGNDTEPALPGVEGGNLWPEVTSSLHRTVPSLQGIDVDARGVRRGRDSTNVGAFEHPTTSSVRNASVEKKSYDVMLIHGSSCDIAPSVEARRVDVYTLDGRSLKTSIVPAGTTRVKWGESTNVIVMIIRGSP